MTIEEFVTEETDLLILLLGLTGVKIKVQLSDDNAPRLKLSSRELRERHIQEIEIYDQDLELVNDRLTAIGYEIRYKDNKSAVYAPVDREEADCEF